MIRLQVVYVLAFVLLVSTVAAVPRLKRSPQFGAGASANAQAFGYGRPGFGGGFGGPGGHFGGPGGNFGGPGGYYGGPRGHFGGPGYGGGFGQGPFGASPFGGGAPTINIAKSVSISRGGGGLSSAQSSSVGRK